MLALSLQELMKIAEAFLSILLQLDMATTSNDNTECETAAVRLPSSCCHIDVSLVSAESPKAKHAKTKHLIFECHTLVQTAFILECTSTSSSG